ncbi:MAG: V-type ATP synthase subunit D [Methanomicrobiales archaeon]|nr:V-type ATP synthase subunit D [Methanomicrobiales archaeon]
MAQKILPNIRPTRIELLKLKKKEVLARKGHDLLEEKRDAMIREFLRLMETYRQDRRRFSEDSRAAFALLAQARTIAGWSGVESAICAVPDRGEIGMDLRHIMGVAVPALRDAGDTPRTKGRGYGYVGIPVAVDEAADAFERVLATALRLAAQEGTLYRIAREIHRTKRRVNALETIMIPRLCATQKHIEAHLEELAREDLFRRKRTKLLQEQRRNAGEDA